MKPTYLIYSMVSSDGRVAPEFIERTDDAEYASKRCKEIESDPYDSGYVEAVNQFSIDRMKIDS